MGITLKKYIWVLGLLASIAMSYMLARITTLIIEGYFPAALVSTSPVSEGETSPVGQAVKETDISVILKRNFFDEKESAIETKTPVNEQETEKTLQATPTGEAQLTTLPINLISTVSVGDGKNKYSSAVIRSNKEEGTYTVESEASFAPNTKIVRILPGKVEFIHENRLEYVMLDDFIAAKPADTTLSSPTDTIAKHVTKSSPISDIVAEGDVVKIPRSFVTQAIAQPDRLYTDIRAVPYYKDGKANGFKILSVKRGSLFEKLGLKRGDVLESINGKLLEIATGFQTFNELKDESDFVLNFERQGEVKEQRYEIVDS